MQRILINFKHHQIVNLTLKECLEQTISLNITREKYPGVLDLSCWNCEHSFTPIGRCWNYHLVVEIRDVKDLRFWNYPCFIINGKLLWQVGKWKPQEISKLKMIWHDTNKSNKSGHWERRIRYLYLFIERTSQSVWDWDFPLMTEETELRLSASHSPGRHEETSLVWKCHSLAFRQRRSLHVKM